MIPDFFITALGKKYFYYDGNEISEDQGNRIMAEGIKPNSEPEYFYVVIMSEKSLKSEMQNYNLKENKKYEIIT